MFRPLERLVLKRLIDVPARMCRAQFGSTAVSVDTTTDKSVSETIKPSFNKPFLKDVFAGIYDKGMLIFPETLSHEQVKNLDNQAKEVKQKLAEIDFSKFSSDPSVISVLKELGLFGHSIPHNYGGMEYTATQILKFVEAFSLNESIASYFFMHNSLGIKCISMFGTEEQKEKYLPKLATGENCIAFCLHEPNSGSDISLVESTAMLSEDGNYYILNGEKTWVANAENASVFIVFAKTDVGVSQDKKEKKLSVMIVERTQEGVTCSPSYQTFNQQDLHVCSVKFENMRIPSSNIIGEPGTGFQIATQVLYGDLFLKAGGWCSILKNVSEQVSNHCIKRKVFGNSLKDFGLIQEKIANINMNIYAMESLSYMTAATVDSYTQPDMLCESAAVKVFSSESLLSSLIDALQIMGSSSCQSDSIVSKSLVDSLTNSLAISTNEILRLYISLNCLQHAGMRLHDSVKKRRNPLNHVGYMLREGWNHLKFSDDSSTLSLKLYDDVHPELATCAESLEIRISKLKKVVIKYWTSFFNNLPSHQLALKKFADVAISVYAMNACLARASRSKAIGLKNCDHEVLLAQTISLKLLKKMDEDLTNLDMGECINGDLNLKRIAEVAVNNGGYAVTHPLTKNW